MNFDEINQEGQNIIHILSREGNKEILVEIFEFLKNDKKKLEIINKEDNKSWTPIYYAIDISESGFPDIVGKSV